MLRAPLAETRPDPDPELEAESALALMGQTWPGGWTTETAELTDTVLGTYLFLAACVAATGRPPQHGQLATMWTRSQASGNATRHIDS
ncbi:hypothetical protein NDU88_008192 [Pleurodeles waltl]|uniref:Uncharacterized protein n=1 Tax=Pleurodeles waltl TaxID=8319 RepID=A0AAV7N5N4_PLEWA|nr:hypothetical protein NDU88_008192 [Pleurodeles waltl]